MFKRINSPGLIFKNFTSLFRFLGGGGRVEKEETGPENKEEGPREGERPPPRNAGEGEKQAGEVGPSGGEAGREVPGRDPSSEEAGPREDELPSFLTFARRTWGCEAGQLGEPKKEEG